MEPIYRPAYGRPLESLVDVSRLGGAVLLTSDMEVFTPRSYDKFSDLLELGPVMPPGATYRDETRELGCRQSQLGTELMHEALVAIGLPHRAVSHVHVTTGYSSHPVDDIQSMFRSLTVDAPDCLLYYNGPSNPRGEWMFAWTDADGDAHCDLLRPEALLIGAGGEDGPPGDRVVVADASCTAQLWLRPATRLRGLVAWEDRAGVGGRGGPPLARWLAGCAPRRPEGVIAAELPPDMGLRRLPAYPPLFWGAVEDYPCSELKEMLWELQSHVTADVQAANRDQLCAELVSRGAGNLLNTIMRCFAHSRHQDADTVLSRSVRMLHGLALYCPGRWWAPGALSEALTATLLIPPARPSCEASLLASVLDCTTACCSRDNACYKEWAGDRGRIAALTVPALRGHWDARCATAACGALSQAASAVGLDAVGDKELLDALQHALLHPWPAAPLAGVQAAATEALLLASLNSMGVKESFMASLVSNSGFLALLETSDAQVAGKLLALLRSILASQRAVDEFGDAQPGGADPEMVAELVAAVLHCLCQHPWSPEVQRWGLAALGILAVVGPDAVEPDAADCVSCAAWALSAPELAGLPAVQQEALFCAHSLMRTHAGCAQLAACDSRLPDLAGSAVRTATQEATEQWAPVAQWALRVLERYVGASGGAERIGPYMEVVVAAVLQPGCAPAVAAAGCSMIHLVATNSSRARDEIRTHQKELVRRLQLCQHASAEAGEADGRVERDLGCWIRVILDLVGGIVPEIEPMPDGEVIPEAPVITKADREERRSKKKKKDEASAS